MKKTFQVINDLEKEGIIRGYALGGATALLFYTEPALTFDVDIFILLPRSHNAKALIDLGPLYSHLKSKGYQAAKEHVLIEGIPVQFLPAYNRVVEEAVRHASIKMYEGVPIKVVTIEYLIAIMIDTDRPKDRERVRRILDEKCFDSAMLDLILNEHSLKNKWAQ